SRAAAVVVVRGARVRGQSLRTRSDADLPGLLAGRATAPPARPRDPARLSGAAAAWAGRRRGAGGNIAAARRGGAFAGRAGHAGQGWRPPPVARERHRLAPAHRRRADRRLPMIAALLLTVAQVSADAPPPQAPRPLA